MTSLFRADAAHEDFKNLVSLLDKELAERDGSEHGFYARYNKINTIRNVIIAYEGNRPVGCGAMKEYDGYTVEIKRMYTIPESRSKGMASLILAALETWAGELNYIRCILETGKRQPEAIRLYSKNGYLLIPNFGQYEGIENSVCFEKNI